MISTLNTDEAPVRRSLVLHGAAAVITMAIAVSLPPSLPAAAAEVGRHDVCRFDSAYLPHTPDAVEGWYAQCRNREAVAAAAGRPTTPDAIDAWLKHERLMSRAQGTDQKVDGRSIS